MVHGTPLGGRKSSVNVMRAKSAEKVGERIFSRRLHLEGVRSTDGEHIGGMSGGEGGAQEGNIEKKCCFI